ncbi:MAG: hypothetical protein H0X62_13830 [Bacteroidetes bacterium]|nr:hypothetical protein [Bacteroidota bacterium]
MASRNIKIWIIAALAILAVLGVYLMPPIPQPQEYHDFTDKRPLLGIPNFMDVVSNLPFFFIGLWGLFIINLNKNKENIKAIFFTIFFGFIILTFGSGYYHWNPNNHTLAYDRVAMAIIFMAFFAFIIYDYIDKNTGKFLLPWLVLIGIISVLWWYWTEVKSEGVLRLYILVQYFPVIAIPLIMVLFKNTYNYRKEVFFIYLFFIIAKLTEETDEEIYNLTGFISGHTLKHFFMAVSVVFIVLLARKRIENKEIT